jgi:hypothetical protein
VNVSRFPNRNVAQREDDLTREGGGLEGEGGGCYRSEGGEGAVDVGGLFELHADGVGAALPLRAGLGGEGVNFLDLNPLLSHEVDEVELRDARAGDAVDDLRGLEDDFENAMGPRRLRVHGRHADVAGDVRQVKKDVRPIVSARHKQRVRLRRIRNGLLPQVLHVHPAPRVLSNFFVC